MKALLQLIACVELVGTTILCGEQSDRTPNDGRMPPFVVNEKMPDPQRDPKTHLEPVPAYDPDGYHHALFRALLGKRRPVLSMVSAATLLNVPESAVLIIDDPFSKPRHWTLERADAKERILNWDITVKQGELDRGIEVDRITLEIPDAFAKKMSAAWGAVLAHVQPEPRAWVVNDGSTILFQHYQLFGQASFPGTAGAPLLLAQLAGKLSQLVTTKPDKRESLMRECVRLADTVIEEAKKL